MSLASYLPPPSVPSVSIQPYIQGFVQVSYRTAPTGNTAVYFRGLPSSYLNFGSTSPANFDLGVSNLFVESWVYIVANQATATSIIGRHNTIASPAEDWMLWISSTGLPRMRVTSTAVVSQDATLATVMNLSQWYHLAGSFDTTNKKIYVFLNGTASAATTFTGTPRYNSTWAIQAGIYTGGQYQNGYTQDIRVVRGGIVPTTSFTPSSAPFGASLPPYVSGNGTNVMSITSQYLSQQGSITSYLPPPSIPSVSIQPYIQGFVQVAYKTAPTGNTAVYFPGLSGSVLNFGTFFPSVADPSTSNIYVEMWIYPTNSNGSLPFTVSDSGSEDMGLLFNFGTQLQFRVWNTTGTQINSTNPGTVTINQWYHIAGSFDFTNNKVYSFVNGVVGSSVGTFTGTARSRATSSLILGAGNAGTFIPFGGYTQDFRFIKGGIVPTTSFTPSSAPFGASLPPYVSGNGTNVMSITSQYLSQQGSIISTTLLLGQLSSIARSNVVGAYSLRAVNGWMSKIINVSRVGTFPSSALSLAASTTGETVDGITYRVSSSTSAAGPPVPNDWMAFDKIQGPGGGNTGYWQPQVSVYNTSTGAYIGSQSLGGTLGEWLKLQLSLGIYLTSYSIQSRSDVIIAPKSWIIYGSNDGTTWSSVDSRSGITFALGETKIFTTTTSSVAYSYFAVVITATNGTFGSTCISEWTLYGFSVGQDFYGDQFGNLLTAPVTGQTLTSWLGGASGNIVTWYDQSGNGNHATQATAANQPVIQKATKGPGYMCVFSGAQNLAGMSYTVLNNTNYFVNVIERRQFNNTSELPVVTSGNVGGNGKVFLLVYNDNTKFSHSHYGPELTYSYGAAVSAYAGSSEPLRYWGADFSQASKEHLYLNGSSFATNTTQFPVLASTAGSFNIGNYPASGTYYTGEIYEILIFTTSLFDLDGTSTMNQIYQNQLSYTGT